MGSLVNSKGIHIATMKRTPAELRLISDGLEGRKDAIAVRVILNEMLPTSLELFSSERITPGQRVSLTIENPKRFFCRASVQECQSPISKSRILSDSPSFRFRIRIAFEFESEDEKKSVSEFYKLIQQQYFKAEKKKAPKKPTTPSESDSDPFAA